MVQVNSCRNAALALIHGHSPLVLTSDNLQLKVSDGSKMYKVRIVGSCRDQSGNGILFLCADNLICECEPEVPVHECTHAVLLRKATEEEAKEFASKTGNGQNQEIMALDLLSYDHQKEEKQSFFVNLRISKLFARII